MNSIIPGTVEEPGLDIPKVVTLEAPSGGAVNGGPLQRDPSGIYRHPDGAGARGRVHPDQSASANAVKTADQAGGNRRCHLLYGNQRRRE